MPNLSRKGDTNTDGGKIIRHAATVYCNNIPVGLHGSPITAHGPGRHKRPNTTNGSPDVFCETAPVLRVTSGCTDGNPIAQGSSNTFVT
jgi:uncharacterized Zn-binding protein involved in type VI secretion